MASSIQKVIEEVIILMAQNAKRLFGEETDNLVMAGGVALNCVANGALQREKIFKNIWVQPAAGDAGGALGAALYYYYQFCNNKRFADEVHDMMKGSYLGPSFSDEYIKSYLDQHGYQYKEYEDLEAFYVEIARLIDDRKVIGLFEGKMEFGPRALGNRSIIGDARSDEMQSRLNLKIKFRESFRPFAPSVLEEDAEKYFKIKSKSPYMLFCAYVQDNLRKEFQLDRCSKESEDDLLEVINKKRSDIPAVTHVDYSARVQTVSEEDNPMYYRILKALREKTGCSVVINTSFNVRGEPVVCTPEDAYLCFMRTDMDVLVLGHMILVKDRQPKLQQQDDWRDRYELD